MPLHIGIVGLPNVGKSTLFNALVRAKSAEAANYPFCTIHPNVGVVEVPDERLDRLTDLVEPEKVVPTAIEFVDIAGLVKGASKGEGLGNQFLSHIREVDAVCEVVRVFPDTDVVHVEGSVDGKRDIATIETELILADLQTLEKRIGKTSGGARTGNKEAKTELAALELVKGALDAGKLASSVTLSEEQEAIVSSLHLLTRKPFLYVANVSEEQLGSLKPETLQKDLHLPSAPVLVSAKIEEELVSLSPEEGREYLGSLGVTSSGLEKLIKQAYDVLGLLTFFTAGPKEVRAWTVRKGAMAPEAAGVIHSDFEKGFICAETIAYDDYISAGSEAVAKERGKMRTEGKGYTVKDGDVFHFRFNV
jgi:GTP-binding protein YchF